MADDIERRLTAAAEALREYEVTTRRTTDLRIRMEELTAQLDSLRAQLTEEAKDVKRLEGVSLTRVLTSLRGARDDALARERAEADAARFRVAEAQARLDAIAREHEAAQARLAQLAEAPATHAAALDEKERGLAESGDPRGRQLLELADERGRLTAELHEIAEARRAGGAALHALSQVQDKLGSASGWSTYDTFFGGGVVGSAIKHSRLDEAAQAAAHADRCLSTLRTELADVGEGGHLTASQVAVSGTTRFIDVWFDNIFTDLSVRGQIKQAQENVARSVQMVNDVQARLVQREAETGTRLAQIDSDRQHLLTQY